MMGSLSSLSYKPVRLKHDNQQTLAAAHTPCARVYTHLTNQLYDPLLDGLQPAVSPR